MTGPQPTRPPLVLSKRALSLYFRVGCDRQFLLYLYSTDAVRAQMGMPPRQGGRAGLGLVGRHGYRHQAEKVHELQTAFGDELVTVGATVDRSGRTAPVDLLTILNSRVPAPYEIVVEAAMRGDKATCRAALRLDGLRDSAGNSVDLSDLIPDLVQILPPLRVHLHDSPSLPRHYREEVLPDGSVALMSEDDTRMRLRVADVKLTSEPGAHYFAEVVFYSMMLAGWLRDHRLEQSFAVVAAPAVVPGSMETSKLMQAMRTWARDAHIPSVAERAAALEADLEIAPVEAFAPRIRQLIMTTLPELLQHGWQDAPWHVDFRCNGCEFLGDPHIRGRDGQPTQNALHCWPEAERTAHLSRIVGLSRGATDVLRANDIHREEDLAAVGIQQGDLPGAFREHHGLRARRTLFPARARSLQRGVAGIIPNSGGDALMPRWPDLHVYLFLDYDPATAFTVTIGCRAFWKEPLPFASPLQSDTRRWGRSQGDTEVFIVDHPTVADEQREFLNFLRHLKAIFDWVRAKDADDERAGRRNARSRLSTYQIYIWDEAQRRHLVRLVSRHLAAILADAALRDLAWLFPPAELLANPDTESRRTPYTLVSDVVQNTLAVPAPHHYTLLGVVSVFNVTGMSTPTVHPLYVDTLSNLAPPERIHEYWSRTRHWQQTQTTLIETAQKKLLALGIVVTGLERQLAPVLSRLAAPPLPTAPPRAAGLAPEANLWLEFTRLNGALDSLEVDRVRAMPAHERESRFRSAVLQRRLRGGERLRAWDALRAADPGLPGLTSDIFIYQLAPDSTNFNARAGEFNFALAPADQHGFLDRHTATFLGNTPIRVRPGSVDESGITGVSIVAIDRQRGLIALQAGYQNVMGQLARYAPQLDLSTNVVLDPVHRDYLTRKVRLTLEAIGNPPCAQTNARVMQALGLPPNRPPGTDPIVPAAEVLWEADQLHARASGRDPNAVRGTLEAYFAATGRVLMADQWAAWEQALNRQFTLIWGPPGTGKSHTLRAIVLGAVLEAVVAQRPLRLLITANTYSAVDGVLLKLQEELRALLRVGPTESTPYQLVRVQSDSRETERDFRTKYPDITNIELNTYQPNQETRQLLQQLERVQNVVIVGAPSQQVHNLAVAGVRSPRPRNTQRNWFDLIVLDEASQMDVATSSLIFSKRAAGGSCVLAGDDLQLPPIHQAAPPDNLENVVGSVYGYMRRERNVPYSALNISFRSNETLLSFTRQAGYDEGLRAHSPNLRINIEPLGTARPADWPPQLPWSPDFARILDPAHPAVCLLYADRSSAQANQKEALDVAALAALLRRTLRAGLLNELDPFGQPLREDGRERQELFGGESFWSRGIGIVVPHRAQMALIANRLIEAFPQDSVDRIRAAVDTVERFQGQERDVILASFGLGDPDIIAAEEEFLYSLNRFNVMASRARAKLIVLLSHTVVEHLSDDTEVLAQSLLLKRYAEQFCLPAEPPSESGEWEIRWR
jgi:DNA replication ATP-dependent helicase Dna2